MKKINKVIALATALILLLSITAFATVEEDMAQIELEVKQEINYIEDIYKYDLSLAKQEEKEEEEKVIEKEVLKYSKAVGIVDALGLIKKNSLGFFREDEVLSIEDFLEIADKLIGFSYDYEELKFVTHDTALRLVMRAAGYDFLPTDAKMMEMAYRLDILDGVQYNAEKYVTRGEMAQLLYNVLSTEVAELMSASSSLSIFGTTEDNTLLQQIYGYEIVEGIVTGANGIDIYENRKVPENTIELDRVSFWYDNKEITTNTLFGHQVYALIETNNNNKIVFIEIDESEEFVTVPFNDINSSGSTIAWENEDGDGRVRTSNISYVVVNGRTYTGNSAFSELNSGEGTISFAKTSGNYYDIAIINKYETYKVNRYSEYDQKLYFADNRTYNGYNYINAEDKQYEFINVIIDGKAAKISDITDKHIVSIFDDGNHFIQIEASSANVSGKISEMYDEDTVGINDKIYGISPSYEKAIENGAKLQPVSIGMEGTFNLNVIGNIAYVTVENGQYKYAVVKKMGTIKSPLGGTIAIRMFDENAEWVETSLSQKVVIDGKKYTDYESAANYVASFGEDIDGTIIRYKLNGDGYITFLDTKKQTSYESNDFDAMTEVEGEPWEGTIEWTQGTTLNNSRYKLKEGAKIFYVPDEVDDEDRYSVMEQKDLVNGTKATLVLYNPDKFLCSKIAIFSGKPTGTFSDKKIFLVTNVRNATDEKGRDVFVLKGLDGEIYAADKKFVEKTYVTTYEMAKQYPNIKSGDTFRRNIDGNGRIDAISYLMTAAEVATRPDTFNGLATINKYDDVWGTIELVSPEDGMALVSVDGETHSFFPECVAVFDCKNKIGESISISDIQPGDRAQIFGDWARDSVVVYRNYE